jgi:hypothetical protein
MTTEFDPTKHRTSMAGTDVLKKYLATRIGTNEMEQAIEWMARDGGVTEVLMELVDRRQADIRIGKRAKQRRDREYALRQQATLARRERRLKAARR